MGLLLLVPGALNNQPHKTINSKIEHLHLCLWQIPLSKALYIALKTCGCGAFASCMFFVILQEQRTDEQRSEACMSDLFVCLVPQVALKSISSQCRKNHKIAHV